MEAREMEMPAAQHRRGSAPWRLTALACSLAGLALVATAALAASSMRATSVRCWPVKACARSHTVVRGGTVLVYGRGFSRGARAIFAAHGGRSRTISVKTRFLSSTRLLARVPGSAISGRVYVTAHGHRSNSVGPLRVKRAGRGRGTPPPPPPASAASGTAFAGNGMWIWYVSQSSGGDPNAIIAQAHQHNISTVFVKSSDGTSMWSQFSPALVSQLKAGGLHVCAWQYVYGSNPASEAAVGAQAVQRGADCLVIDAEKEYEGRYRQADTYMTDLRQAIGSSYPVGLAGFPYVDYHPAFPYSVFLGTGGAQFNLPQIYWKAIGVSVDSALNHTYRFNRPYGKTIAPLGQAYDGTTGADIVRFRQLAGADGSPGVSWWDWQEATPYEWQAIGEQLPPLSGAGPAQDYAVLGQGAKGDLVVWAQEHLDAAGQQVALDGDFGQGTRQAVVNFQRAAGLGVSGQIDSATWTALLSHATPHYSWASGHATAASAAGARTTGPPTASLPAKRYELPPPGKR